MADALAAELTTNNTNIQTAVPSIKLAFWHIVMVVAYRVSHKIRISTHIITFVFCNKVIYQLNRFYFYLSSPCRVVVVVTVSVTEVVVVVAVTAVFSDSSQDPTWTSSMANPWRQLSSSLEHSDSYVIPSLPQWGTVSSEQNPDKSRQPTKNRCLLDLLRLSNLLQTLFGTAICFSAIFGCCCCIPSRWV